MVCSNIESKYCEEFPTLIKLKRNCRPFLNTQAFQTTRLAFTECDHVFEANQTRGHFSFPILTKQTSKHWHNADALKNVGSLLPANIQVKALNYSSSAIISLFQCIYAFVRFNTCNRMFVIRRESRDL